MYITFPYLDSYLIQLRMKYCTYNKYFVKVTWWCSIELLMSDEIVSEHADTSPCSGW